MTLPFTSRFRWVWLLAVWCLGAGQAVAQSSPLGQFGNEWIRAGQPYYKVKVGQRGIHRLSSAWLTAAGVPLTGLDPHRLQLWRRGQEVAIYVAGEADGQFDATDYVDFWGVPNDGLLDAEQYKDPAHQTTLLTSLYTDTAAYFLTIAPAGAPSRRMSALVSTPGSLTPVRHHITQLVQQPTPLFYERGPEYDNFSFAKMPWVDKTEGFVGKVFGIASQPSGLLSVTAPLPPDTTHLAPHLEVMIASFGYAPNPLKFEVLRGSGASATVIRSFGPYPAMAPYSHQLFDLPLHYADFNTGGVISFRVVVENAPASPSSASYTSIVFAKLKSAAANALARQSRVVITDSTLAGASQYLLFDTAPLTPVAFDVTDPTAPTRITGQAVGAQWGVVVPTPSGGPQQVFITNDASPRVPPPGRAVSLRQLAPIPGAFLLVTGRQLMTDSTGIHPIRDYAAYRASAPGGGYDTVVMTMDQLYDVFHYGDASPNAIRRFALFMSSGAGPAGYLFLVGKGNQFQARAGNNGTLAHNRDLYNQSIVPAFGYPASDVIFTADFRNGRYGPRVPTGRIAALSAAEVAVYLEKIQGHEAAPPAPWRKEVLHLGGGKNTFEQTTFSNYLNSYARRIEDSVYFGGHVSSILRGNTGQNVTSVNVSTQVNNGLSLITFFGHSSPTISDIDIGLASDPLANYHNVGRYPMMVVNGCNSGDVFVPNSRTFGEDWIFAPRRGAFAFMAYGGNGYPSHLNLYCNAFYKAAFNDSTSYGRGIGDQQQRGIELASPSLLAFNENGIVQITQTILQGDPAARLYSPLQPDYAIDNGTITLQSLPGERLTARASGVQLRVAVRNFGKATLDTLRIEVKRTYPNSTTGPQIVHYTFRPVFFSDTAYILIPNLASANVQGANTFEVTVDWPDSVREMNETNNRASLQYSFPSGSVFALFPQEFAIVPTHTPGLVGEYDQPLAQNRDYTFELDTVAAFNSPLRVQQVINAGRYPIWRPTLPTLSGQDSVVWYWRFRPRNILPGEDSTWATSSLRYLPASAGGWSQSHHGQFARDRKISLRQNTTPAPNNPLNHWSYAPSLLRLVLRTVSGDSTRYQVSTAPNTGRTFSTPPNGITFNGSNMMPQNYLQEVLSNLILMVFDPRTLQPVTSADSIYNGRPIADPTSFWGEDNGDPIPANRIYSVLSAYGAGSVVSNFTAPPRTDGTFALMTAVKRAGVNRYDTLLTSRSDSLAKIIERIPNGYIVAMVSANRVPFDSIRAKKPALMAAMRSIGSSLIDQLHNGDPFAIVGVKGGAPGSAVEKTYNPSLPRRWGQAIVLDELRQTYEPRGTVMSTVIGPVQRWLDVVQTVKKESTTSSYSLQLVPIDTAGRDGAPIAVTIPAAPVNSTSSFNLSGLDASLYPKARLELATQDSVNRQAPQLKQWLVTYEGVPEGIVRTDSVPASALDLTAQVEAGAVKLRVPFQNISSVRFRDSIVVEYKLIFGGNPIATKQVKIGALKPDSLGWASAQFNARALASGDYLLRAVVNPGPLQPEQYDFNNTLEATFKVVNPNLAPLVDVAFDGQHILHGDIVAPAPVISITVRDEDRNARLDSSQVVLVLTRPGATVGERVDMASSQVRIQRATATEPMRVTYEPGRLADGVYRLDVQATDPAGNLAGTTPYNSEFRVINETMISNFYPYPNPFSTSTRFLFTVTGKVPQNLKIQIMTVTGKVVREITKEELGTDLRVGNNTSTSTWNGTDEYGNQLANGVYLYRVVVQDDADTFKSFKTAGDSKAFHKTWGKLYILR